MHAFLEQAGLFGSEFVFLSCGDFDGHQIRREAVFKRLQVPNYLKRWINFKKVFPVHLFDAKAEEPKFTFIKDVQKSVVRGMEDMLQQCGLELKGRHHSGIDDARNIAACVVKSMEKGFEFTQGMVLSHPFSIEGEPQEEEMKE